MQPQARSAATSRSAFGSRTFHDSRRAWAGSVHIGTTGQGLVVLDHAVLDPDAFLAAVPPGFDVLRLGPSAEPLAALSRFFDDAPPYASLHIVSHGRPGALLLAGRTVDGRLLRERRAEVEAIGRRLVQPADVFLYGCEVAQGAEGRAFVGVLASLLGAGVAASATPTGSASRGGDWRLGVTAGRPVGRPLFGAREMSGYRGLLAAPSTTLATGWVDVVKGAAFDPSGDAQAGTAGLDLVGDASRALLQAQSLTAADGTAYTGFRILYGGSSPGTYYFVGFDADGNGSLDAFLCVKPSGGGAGVYVYDADPTKPNDSPSTTGIVNTAANPRIALTNTSYGSVAVDAGSSRFVVWVATNDLIAAINTKSGAGITASSPLSYLVFTATQDNSINGDLGGAATNSTQTFASLGVLTRQSLSAPTATSVPAPTNLALVSDTGASASDRVTSNGAVAGTAQAGATVTLREGTTVLGTATADGSGRWTITPAGLAQGSHTVTATASDGSGNTGPASSGLTYTLDTLAPTAAITSPGGPTNRTAQTVTGTAEAGSAVTLRDGAAVLGTATAGTDGTWSVGVTLTGEGAHSLTATATDAAGNTGTSSTVGYTLDTQPPGAPPATSVMDDAGPVTGALSNGARTDDADPAVRVELAGTGAKTGDTVRLYDGTGTTKPLGGSYTLTGADVATGFATLQTGALTDGTTYAITARLTDAAGNQGAASAAFAVTEDTTAPSAPAITGTGGLTNRPTQTVTGTAEANSTVELFDGAVSLGTATAGADGAWSKTVTLSGEGAHGLTARATDAAGNTGTASAPVGYTLDTAAPLAPTVAGFTPDTGTAGDGVTAGDGAGRVTLNGTAEAGSMVTLTDRSGGSAGVLGTARADGTGAWSFTPAAAIAEGAHSITAAATDAAGNASASSAALALTIDRTAPASPTAPALAAGGDSGTEGDGRTNVVTPTLTGTAEAGSTVTLTDRTGSGVVVLGTVQAGGTGHWSLTRPSLAEGAHSITATATDAAGNVSAPAGAFALTIDTAAPAAPATPALAAGSDGGVEGDGRTNTAAPTLTGTAEAGSTVTVSDGTGAGAVVLGTARADGTGHWSFVSPALSEGAHSITATTTDAAGNVSPPSGTFALTIDTAAPSAPAGLALAPATDSGTRGDGVTNVARPALTGTAEAGSTVTLTDGTGTAAVVLGTARADGDGLWSFTGPALAEGAHAITATATDVAGNRGATSTTFGLVIDTTAPAAAITSPGGLTRQASHRVAGTAEASSTVVLSEGATVLGTATVGADGTWSVDGVLSGEGAHSLTATATDAAGNTGTGATVGYTLDTRAPAVNSVAASPGTGILKAGDSVTFTVALDEAVTVTPGAGGGIPTLALNNGGTATHTGTDPSGRALTFDYTVQPGQDTADLRVTGTALNGATILDAAGNPADLSGAAAEPDGTLAIDTTAPPAPPAVLAVDDAGPVTGTLSSGASTDDTDLAVTVDLAGTGAQAGDAVWLYDGADTTNPLGGSYTLTGADIAAGFTTLQTGPLADGTTYAITARITDTAGNQGAASAAFAVTADTTAPVPAITGAGGPTNQATQTISGTAGAGGAGSTVALYDGGTALGTAVVQGDGRWSAGVTLTGEGTHNITAVATDAAGNTGTSPAVSYTLDTRAPEVTGAAADAAPGTALNAGTTVTFTVAADEAVTVGGTPVLVLSNGVTAAYTGIGADGKTLEFAYTVEVGQDTPDLRVSGLRDGTITDAAGNALDAIGAVLDTGIAVDTAAPLAPAITGFTPDTGAAGDGVTAGDASHQVTLSGTAEAGSTVSIYDNGDTTPVATVTAVGGDWTYTTTGLAEGEHAFTATATDAAGNTGAASDPFVVTLSTGAPSSPSIVAVADDTGPVTGTLSRGASTDDTDLTVRVDLPVDGSAKAGDTVRLHNTSGTGAPLGGSHTLTDADIAAGFATLQTGPLTDGATYAITARLTDAAGQSTVSTAFTVTEDTAAPPAPTITGTGGPSNRTAQTVAGTVEAGSTVEVFDGAVSLGTATAGADGTWSMSVTLTGEGARSLTATATDVAGNASPASTPFALTIDTGAPSAPVGLALAPATDSGTRDDGVTNVARPALTGTAEAGSTVTLTDGTGADAVVLGTARADADGTWSFVGPVLAEGAHSITAVATDAAGNTSAASGALALTVDATAPAAPALAGGSDGGVEGDGRTNTATPTLTGTAEAGSTVTLSDGTLRLGTAQADAAGRWSFTSPALAEGAHGITAAATDAAGNASAASGALAITVDTAAPVSPTGLALASASDSGAKGDGLTNSGTPTLIGTAEPGSTVALTSGGTPLGTATADTGGRWSITTGPLAEGTHSLTATATDAAGNASAASAPLALTIDTKPPVVAAALLHDTGPSGTDRATSDATLAGDGDPGAIVTVGEGGQVLGSTPADAAGHWTLALRDLTAGAHTLDVGQTDAAGNTGTARVDLTLDAASPAAPAGPALAPASDSGAGGDGATGATRPVIVGTAEAGTTVTLFDDGAELGTAVAGQDGTWSFVPAAPLGEGTHRLTAAATDAAGNVSAASAPFALTIDATAPAVPAAPALDAASDGGAEGDGVTDVTMPTLTGTAEPGSTVTLTDGSGGDAVALGTARADGTGRWSFAPTAALSEGTHSITATATDAAGNASAASAPLVLTVDTGAPPAPVGVALTPASDSGTAGDGRTNVAAPTLTGTAEAGNTVTLYDRSGGAAALGTARADATGRWSFTGPTLAEGFHSLVATATDAAGNASAGSGALALTIDTTGPVVSRISTSPTGGVLGAGRTIAFTVAASEPLRVNTGAGSPSLLLDNGGTATYSGTSDDGALVFTATVAPGQDSPGLKVAGLAPNGAALTDAAGNPVDLSGLSAAPGADTGLVIDTTSPDEMAALVLAPASDSGAPGDGVTSVAGPTLTGVADPGSTVTITDGAGAGAVVLGSVRAGADGAWSFTVSTLAEGAHSITATATDAGDNTSTVSNALALTIDTAAPVAPAAPALAAASDSGAAGDGRTNATAPTLTGTAEPGSTVTVSDGAVRLGVARADATGRWSFACPVLSDGVHSITVTAADAAGNASPASVALALTIDSASPAAPSAFAVAPGSDGGAGGDGRTNVTAPILTGTAEAGSTVTLVAGSGGDAVLLGSVQADGTGHWSLAAPTLAEGAHSITATATDAEGNTSPASAALALTIDTTGPVVSRISTSPAGGVLGAGRTVTFTLTTSEALRADTTAGSPFLLLSDGGSATYSGASDDGALVFTATVAPGRNSPGLKVVGFAPNGAILTDAAGNSADLSGIQTVDGADTGLSIDTAAPAAPSALALAPGSDGGVGGDGLTNSSTPTLTGTAEPGSTVTLTAGDTPLGITQADGDGRWSVTPGTPLNDGTYQIAAIATDAAGNTSAVSGSFTLTISTVTPTAPAGLDFASGSDGGSEGDGLTNVAAPTLTGTAEPGSTVTLTDRTGGGSSVLGTARADGTGHWSFTGPTLADGAHSITAAVTDAAGNTATGAALDFVLDSAPPTVTGIAAEGDRLTISYSETVDLAGPASSAYSVTVNGVAATVTGVVVEPEARTVVLTLAGPVLHGDGVVVSYSGVGLGDAAGNTAPAFAPFSATNVTGDRTAPVPRLGVVNGTRLVLGFTEEGGLAATAPAADAFAVYAGDRVFAVSSAEVDPTANVVVLTLSDPIGFGAAVTLDYAAPADAARAVRDDAGNPLASFAGLRVTNATADTDPPVPVVATYAGSAVTLALADASPLDAADSLSAAAFSVVRTAGASSVTLRPSGVIIDPLGKSVTLILPVSLTGASSVMLSYTDPGQGAPGPLQDTWHNRVLSFDRLVVSPEDRDGVGPEEEAGVPGLPGAQGLVVPGDGNGDGVPDAIQPDVASFGFAPPGATHPAPTDYATLVAVAEPASRFVAQLNDVSHRSAVAGAPGAMIAPFGEFHFRSTVDTPGGSQTFHLILPDDPSVTGYWKLNRSSGQWEDIATSVDRSKPGFMTLGFSIQDGGIFDDDGIVDGVIFDPGVPGSLAPAAPAGDPPAPSVSPLVVNRAAPAISGSWGGMNGGTDTLSVTVAGITYTAGASPALQVIGTSWSLQLPALADGTYAVAATSTRDGGGSARAVGGDALTIDTVAPSVSIGLTRDSNAFRTVGILRTEALTGTATPGATLTLTDGDTAIGTVQADAAGAWSFLPTGLDDGAHTILAREFDAAGNVGSASLAFSPVTPPAAVDGISTADWRSMDLAQLLNDGGKLQFIAGTERVLLADGTLSVGGDTNEAFLTRLYHGLLGRPPEAEGIAWWQHLHAHGASKAAFADGFLRSAEYNAGNTGQTDAQFVQRLYQGVLGREGAVWEVALWAEQLDGGRTRAAVLADVADSPEAKRHWAGVTSAGVWVRDTDAAVVREAYLAAFGREADAGGLRFWTGALRGGATPSQVGTGISASAEFQARHAQEDDARFVESLYADGLGRPGEARGAAGWVDALQTGAMTRGDVLMDFARSAEGQHHLHWAL